MKSINTDNLNIIEYMQNLLTNRETGVFALVINTSGSSPSRVGAKMIVLPDGDIHGTVGGGELESRVIADALSALASSKGPCTLHYNLNILGMNCGGGVDVYLEPLIALPRIIIYGAGHVGCALARVCKMLGCYVKVVDERKEWANPKRLGRVDEIVTRPFDEELDHSLPGVGDHVIIATRGHEQDFFILENIIECRLAYLGMLGSNKKVEQMFDRLRAKGVSEELVKTVRSPVGLDIGAVSPEEIAISIAAELISLWRKGEVDVERMAPLMR